MKRNEKTGKRLRRIETYVQTIHADVDPLDQGLKGPVRSDRSQVRERNRGQHLGESSLSDEVADKGLLLVGEAGDGQSGADELLHELTRQGRRSVVLARGGEKGADATDGGVEEQETLAESDVLACVPGVLVQSADHTLVGTVLAACSKGRL